MKIQNSEKYKGSMEITNSTSEPLHLLNYTTAYIEGFSFWIPKYTPKGESSRQMSTSTLLEIFNRVANKNDCKLEDVKIDEHGCMRYDIYTEGICMIGLFFVQIEKEVEKKIKELES